MVGNQRMKHESSTARRASGRATDRFEATQPRGDPTGMSQAEQASISYDYGYTGNYGSLQSNELQYQDYAQQEQQAQQAQQVQHAQAQRVPRRRPQEAFYDSMLYFNQQGPAQGPFEDVPQYQTRQSAAIETLNQFAVPQYFEDSAGSGVPVLSSYLNPIPYNQPGPMRPTTQFPTSFPIGSESMNRLEPELSLQSDPSNLEEAVGRYQRVLRRTFDHTRAGRLVEAGGLLLEISEWLVTNARDLGLLRDDGIHYSDRLKLWNDFNLCWLAFCQKQKDLMLAMIAGHPSHISLLHRDRLEAMGKDLVQLCDQLEQHGLVDYQMGIWEEEILSVLGQSLDLMDSRPELPDPIGARP
ncbi:uncharacterized protein N7511_007864 [Penicillium nucicola]|uniref:uncharacterized protein n=1 Tax=Penicillium nucicola TaxID=1850975 RepID=UPI0025450AFB|nr:uncharacterized protein N7511_007864 [Penicillium nucicola]KAJ5753711.1 hypothetical protein N7511_007864 [Penicillium nucicola]